jgi:hypothetical protein
MQTMRHSSKVYSAPPLVGSATVLLGLVRHGRWRWRAGGPMQFIVEEVVDTIPYDDSGPASDLNLFHSLLKLKST